MAIGRNPRWAARPEGTTAAPCLDRRPVEEIPPPREDLLLATHIDWTWVRRVIDAGDSVLIIVGRDDWRSLLDVAQSRLGYDLVLRVTDDDVVWLCRPGALLGGGT